MNKIDKFRLKNPYMYLSLIALFISLCLSWIVNGEVFKVIFHDSYQVIKEGEYMTREQYLDTVLENMLTWEYTWMNAFLYLVNLFPIFPSIVAIGFLRELKGYYPYAIIRLKHPKKELVLTCTKYAICGGVSVSAALCLFNVVFAPFLKASLLDIGGADDLFPKNFYPLHPFCVLNVLSVTVYFLIGFAFTFLACSTALWAKNAAYVLCIPFIVYTVENFVSRELGGIFPLQSEECVLAFNTSYNILQLCVPALVLIGISICAVMLRICQKKNWSISDGGEE